MEFPEVVPEPCLGPRQGCLFIRPRALEALARPQISSVSRVRNMLVIVLGALVLIGVFVFLCDVTDLWNIVLNKTEKR